MRVYAAVHHRDRGRNYIFRPRKYNIMVIIKYNVYILQVTANSGWYI